MTRPNINAMRSKIAATEVFAKPEQEQPVQPILVTQLDRLRAQRAAQPQEAAEAPVEPSQPPVNTPEFIKERAAKKAAIAARPKPVKQPEPKPAPKVVEKTKTDDSVSWADLLGTNKDGNPYANTANMLITMNHAPALVGAVAYDTFNHAMVRVRDIGGDTCQPVNWTAIDTTRVEVWVQQNTPMTSMTDKAVAKIVDMVGQQTTIDTLMQATESRAKWDEDKRIDTWLIDYAGAEDNHLNRVIGRKFLIGMINRAMIPGCTCKRSLVLFGKQNIGKSGLCRILAGNDQWFDTDVRDMDNAVTTGNQLRGKWLIEISEGCGISKADRNSLKKFLSKHADQFTQKYEKLDSHIPRRVSFIITTNDVELFNDPTGNSRFAPVEIGQVDFAGLTAVRDQLFAEAYAAHLAGERNEHTPEDEAAIEERCKNYSVSDEMEPAIAKFLSGVVHETMLKDVMKSVGIPFSPNGAMVKRVKDILVKFGWVTKRRDGFNYLCRTETSFPPVDPEVADRAANGTTNIRSMRSRMRG